MLRQVHRRRTRHIHFSPVIAGVAPLEARKGCSSLRHLQSLRGIFPIGAFLVEHFFSNPFARNGANAYNENVPFLVGCPLFFSWSCSSSGFASSITQARALVPGRAKRGEYPWTVNWMYVAQR